VTTSASSGFSETARILTAEQLPEVSWDFVYGTNMHHGFTLARKLLARESGTKQIIMITDGEPTAHIEPGASACRTSSTRRCCATVEATLREVVTAAPANGIRINTFVLDATSTLRDFVEHDQPHQRRAGVLHDAGASRRLRAGRFHAGQA
jgi:uncharacterized protein with von Willebrand factor type A (vWA) domain